MRRRRHVECLWALALSLAAGLLVTAALAGCGTDEAALDGTSWKLVRWNETALDPADFTITADFEDGRIGGTSAVNNYGGLYETGADGAFSVGPLSSTMMAGTGDAGRAERVYLELLEAAASYEVVGDTLTLFDESGDPVLVFASVPAAD